MSVSPQQQLQTSQRQSLLLLCRRRVTLSRTCCLLLTSPFLGRSSQQQQQQHLIIPSCLAFSHHHGVRGQVRDYYSYRSLRRDSASFVQLFSTMPSNIIANQIRESYKERETDGVVDLILSSSWMMNRDVDVHKTLVPSIFEAVVDKQNKKGSVASIMNAMIASCCCLSTDNDTLKDEDATAWISGRVQDLLEAYKDMETDFGITMDLLSYSLAYVTLQNDPKSQHLALDILEQARRQSKKQAGSKRRRTLTNLRRHKGNSILFTEAEPTLRQLLGNDFQLLMENKDFAVINKPSGISCFHRKATSAGKINKYKGKDPSIIIPPSDISLEDALIKCNLPLSTLNQDAMGLVHRLDRGSSGCIVLAKTDDMHARLVTEFFLRRTTKTYVALLQQTSHTSLQQQQQQQQPLQDEGIIDRPVHGRPAKTKYRVLQQSNGLSLVEFEIFTGRKHQIRVHASEALASPILKDILYGGDNDQNTGSSIIKTKKRKDAPEQFFLHAQRLTIPRLGIHVEASIPSFWQEFLDKM
jgi:23S rRNA-/tRNA-specific pseudouridylate synthase